MPTLSNHMKMFLAAMLVAATAGAAPIEPDRVEWPRTDFSRHTVDLSEIESGGPPKDGIPAISILRPKC